MKTCGDRNMQLRREGHRYIETILKYYEGCNTADVDKMMSTFTDDVVHYFVDHSEVRSARGLADYWARVGPLTQANWALDHTVIQEPEAVIEWSMRWVPRQTGEPELLRGSEWYLFEGDKIKEIRSYHANFYLASTGNAQLHDFDYAQRGYRQL
jgi:hypothetical protein